MFYQAARRGDNAFFKYILTLLSTVIGAVVGQIPLMIVVAREASNQGVALEGFDIYGLGLDENYLLFLLLLSFLGAAAGLYLGVRYFHFKRIKDILSGRPRLDWGRIAFGFLLWLGLNALIEVFSYWSVPEAYTFQFEPAPFALLLLLSVTLLLVQTSVEEALFRGYLLQGLGLAFRYRWIALLITSLCFGILHFANLEVDTFGAEVMMAYYIGIGLILGIITLMDEGAELALGMHAATNIYGATFVGYAGSSLQTPALFHLKSMNAPLMLLAAMLSGLVFVGLAARRYGWSDWGKLLRRVPEAKLREPDGAFYESEND